MEKEPKELVEARRRLNEFEKLLEDPNGRNHLKQAIALLFDVTESDCHQVYKNTAKNLVSSYRDKVLSAVKRVLSNASSFGQDEL